MTDLKINYEEASKFSGWLQKESPGFLKNYQKRYFSILNGRFLVYSEKEGSEVKGTIDIKDADINGNLSNVKNFLVVFGEREFKLKAENEQEKLKWVKVLNTIKEHLNRKQSFIKTQRSDSFLEEIPERNRNNTRTLGKKDMHKLVNLESEALSALQKAGKVVNQDLENSKKCLAVKGIQKHMNSLNKEIQESRLIYGFLEKRHKSSMELYQKRWCFLISSRPLTEEGYENDDIQLEENILPSFLMFDTIFYYKFKNENDDSEAKGKIPLSDCHGVEIREVEGKYYITIDLGDRKFEFLSELKGERDRWFEAIRCSRKTAKDFKISITKKPRNLNRISNIVEKEGITALREICEKDKEKCIGCIKEISSIEVLEILINNLQNSLFQTIDGCVLYNPPKMDIMKVYIDTFNLDILLNVQSFWKSNYDHISNLDLVSLGCLLYDQEEKLVAFGVNDPNFSYNGKEIFKIYSKKTFSVLRELLQNIMRSEREVKAIKAGDDTLITNAPTDIFKLFYETLDLLKNKKTKALYEYFLLIVKEIVMNYLISIDYILSRTDLDIDKEFMIAVTNNSIRINSQLSDLIEDLKQLCILDEKELEGHLKYRDVCNSLNMISNSAITRLVSELYDLIVQEFSNTFIEVEVNKILEITLDVYRKFVSLMHLSSQKRMWNEVLNSTLFHYIKSLLTSAHKKVKKLSDITDKLKNDKCIISAAYELFLGKNATLESVKIIDDFLDFLETSPDMMSISCSKLRQLHGNAFSTSTAKALINLRVDLSAAEKKEAIDTCKEFLEKLEKNEKSNPNKTKNKLFDMIDEDMREHEKIELEEKKLEDQNLEEVQTNKNTKTVSLNDFLKLDLGGDEDEEDEEDKEEEKEYVFRKNPVEKTSKDSDEIMTGNMKKKSYTTWQQRYFTLKNGYLYWYKDNLSREASNFFYLMDCKKVATYKPKKFLMVIKEKVYKFSCESEESKDKWIEALQNEMKKLKTVNEKKLENLYQVKLKKRIINDMENLPAIKSDINEITKYIEECIINENCFNKKEKVIKKKTDLIPNKVIVEQKVEVKDEKMRLQINSSESSSNVSSLNVSLLSKKQSKQHSIFSFCNRICMCFKKKKAYDEIEETSTK